jgi:hypothetical protein
VHSMISVFWVSGYCRGRAIVRVLDVCDQRVAEEKQVGAVSVLTGGFFAKDIIGDDSKPAQATTYTLERGLNKSNQITR